MEDGHTRRYDLRRVGRHGLRLVKNAPGQLTIFASRVQQPGQANARRRILRFDGQMFFQFTNGLIVVAASQRQVDPMSTKNRKRLRRGIDDFLGFQVSLLALEQSDQPIRQVKPAGFVGQRQAVGLLSLSQPAQPLLQCPQCKGGFLPGRLFPHAFFEQLEDFPLPRTPMPMPGFEPLTSLRVLPANTRISFDRSDLVDDPLRRNLIPAELRNGKKQEADIHVARKVGGDFSSQSYGGFPIAVGQEKPDQGLLGPRLLLSRQLIHGPLERLAHLVKSFLAPKEIGESNPRVGQVAVGLYGAAASGQRLGHPTGSGQQIHPLHFGRQRVVALSDGLLKLRQGFIGASLIRQDAGHEPPDLHILGKLFPLGGQV